jgi:DNA polymerase-3 subunit delta
MPVHLYWGDDGAALQRAVDDLIAASLDPAWAGLNLSRFDGADPARAAEALEAVREAPLGGGHRVVVVQRSPFCHACPADLARLLEAGLPCIPDSGHLVLCRESRPDARLRTTKALRAIAEERSFQRPAAWDETGQLAAVTGTAEALGVRLEPAAAEALMDCVGSDTARLTAELEKLSLYCAGRAVDAAAVAALCERGGGTSLAVGEALLQRRPGEALAQLERLLRHGEPPLRIVASLTGQIRGWLWVALLDREGERDVAVIARAAGIRNPKRVHVLRRQLQGASPAWLMDLLGRLLQVEVALKRGSAGMDAFRDGLLLSEHR